MFDGSVWQSIFLIALMSGVIGLDRTAAGQFMISQPIVAAPLAGWVLGDASAGFLIGAILELIWMLDIAVGTFVPADSTIAAVTATAVAVLGSRGAPASPELIGFCILLSAATAPLTMAADRVIRNFNGGMANRAMQADDANLERSVVCAQGKGLAVFFLKYFLLCLALVPAGLAATAVFISLPPRVHAAFSLFVKLLPLLGAAVALHKLSRETLDRFMLFGFAAAMLSVFLFRFHPAVAVLAAAVSGWLGVRSHER